MLIIYNQHVFNYNSYKLFNKIPTKGNRQRRRRVPNHQSVNLIMDARSVEFLNLLLQFVYFASGSNKHIRRKKSD